MKIVVNTKRFSILLALALVSSCASRPFAVKRVSDGIWRSSQPVTDADYIALTNRNVHVIEKLNSELLTQERAMCHKYGLILIYIPIPWYEQVFGVPAEKIAAAVDCIRPDGTDVHCLHGQDRTGAVVGRYRVVVQKWEPRIAYAEMEANGFHPLLAGLYQAFDN